MVRRRAMIEPDSRPTQFYEREIYPRYTALYGALKSVRGLVRGVSPIIYICILR
jgi:hypothetical protein